MEQSSGEKPTLPDEKKTVLASFNPAESLAEFMEIQKSIHEQTRRARQSVSSRKSTIRKNYRRV